jgi:hypothetical protein
MIYQFIADVTYEDAFDILNFLSKVIEAGAVVKDIVPEGPGGGWPTITLEFEEFALDSIHALYDSNLNREKWIKTYCIEN